MQKLLSRIFIGIGIVLLLSTAFLLWQRYNPYQLSFKTIPAQTTATASAELKPILIAIPDAHIYLPIFPATVTGNRWQSTTQGVSYLTSSPIPGTVGNSILYGHNWKSLLGNLTETKPGQLIEVTLSDGSIAKFEITYTTVVTPDQTQILDQTTDSRLTIYTCTGLLDTKRFVATALLKK